MGVGHALMPVLMAPLFLMMKMIKLKNAISAVIASLKDWSHFARFAVRDRRFSLGI